MLYPIVLAQVTPDVALYIPDPQRVRATYEQLSAADPSTAFPFWAKIWSSGYVLATFLQEEPHWIQTKQVLEIGAGIALPSFTIAHEAATVVVTDHAPEAVALMNKNITHLGLKNVTSLYLDWNDLPQNLRADVLLLSDINYADAQFGALLVLIRRFLSQGSTIILTTPQRINAGPFAEALQSYVVRSEVRVYEGVEVRVMVLK